MFTTDISNGMAHTMAVEMDCTLSNGHHSSHLDTRYSPIFNQEHDQLDPDWVVGSMTCQYENWVPCNYVMEIPKGFT